MIDELNGDFLQWLRGFYYVAKTGSLRKAAEIMNRNPSTISYQIRSLEEELGTLLFDRYKKSMRITPEGRNLLGWTISTFETLLSMRSSVGNARGDLQGHVHIAATLPMVTMCVCAISKFTRQHPRVNLVIDRGLSTEVKNAVAESEVDFGLLALTTPPEMDVFEPLLTARPILVARRDNSWGIPDKPQMEDLKELPYVSFVGGSYQIDPYGDRSSNVAILHEWIMNNSVIQINNFHLIMRFVWNRLGVAIMDELCYYASCYGADWDELAAWPLDHLLPHRIYGILTRRHKHISPQARAFMNKVREYYASLGSADDPDAWSRIRHNDKSAQC